MAQEMYVGIDVSKAELVVAVRPSGERMTLSNDRAGIKRLVARLSELKPQLVVVEATGGLQIPLPRDAGERNILRSAEGPGQAAFPDSLLKWLAR